MLMYDEVRDLITDSYTVSEWEALAEGVDLDDTGPIEPDDEEEFCPMEDLDI